MGFVAQTHNMVKLKEKSKSKKLIEMVKSIPVDVDDL
jgi:hypothetical protein